MKFSILLNTISCLLLFYHSQAFAQKITIGSSSDGLDYNNQEYVVETGNTAIIISNSKIKAKSMEINCEKGELAGVKLGAEKIIRLNVAELTLSNLTILTCEKLTITKAITLTLKGNIVINCDELELGDNEVTLKRKAGASLANLTINYKQLTAGSKQAFKPDGDVKLISILKK